MDDRGRAPLVRKKQFQPRRGDRKTHRQSQHSSHLAEPVEPNTQEEPYSHEDEEVDADNEDLEQEALWNEEEEGDEDYEDATDEEEDEDFADVEDLKEAYASGWRAKQKSADQRKARGYRNPRSSGSKGKGKGEKRSTDERKKRSQCASCKQYGHWHGDADCPNVKSGKDPPRQAGTGGTIVNYTSAEGSPVSVKQEDGRTKVHRVNWTFPVNTDGWDLLEAYTSEPEEDEDEFRSTEEVLPFSAGARPEADRRVTDRVRKHRMALKTVLEALIAEEEDEEVQQRLRKKEYKSAREEERRQKRDKEEPKRFTTEAKPMDLDLTPIKRASDGPASYGDLREASPIQSPEERARGDSGRACA